MRFLTTVVYQRTGQVNVGVGQQMNVGAPITDGPAPEETGIQQPWNADDSDQHGSNEIRSNLSDPRESVSSASSAFHGCSVQTPVNS